MARRKKGLSGADEALWRLAVRDVEPLPARAARAVPDAAPVSFSPPPSAVRRPMSAPLPMPLLRTPSASLPDQAPNQAPNWQWDRKLRRGTMEIDARLDLHGQTELQAYRRLMRFVTEAAAQGARRLLVITGKGRSGQGLLKQRLPDWLSSGTLGPLVMAVRPAHVKDGGDGAFYVILRRRRS